MDTASEVARILGLSSTVDVQLDDETFGVGGFLSYRRRGRVRSNKDTEQIHLFIKLSDTSRSELEQSQEFSHRACRNECLFYGVMCPILDRVSSRCRLRPAHPRVFGERVMETASILVMEDLVEQGFCPVEKKLLTLEEAECVVKTMAELQAAYWMSRTSVNYSADAALFGWDSIFHESKKGNQNPIIEFSINFFNENFGKFVQSKEDEMAILKALPKLRSVATSDPHSDKSRPLGIVHGDLWFSNIMFKNSNDSLECKIFDWQFWSIGLFGCDVGQLALTCLPTDVVKSELSNLMRTYYRTFKEAFVNGSGEEVPFSEEEAMKNLSDSLIRGFLWNVVAFTTAFNKRVFETGNILSSIAHVIHTEMLQFPSP